MRFTRWWNPSLPQTLLIGVLLLYLNAAFGFLSMIGLPIGNSAYQLAPLLFATGSMTADSFNAIQALAVVVGALAYGFGALGIANGQQVGWKVGVAVAAGALVLPVVAVVRGVDLRGTYFLSYLFDLALFVVLVHPQSREHQRIWFEGAAKRRRR
jgi:hypothetical protein